MSNEQRYFDALKRISKYQPPERLKKNAWRDYGLDDGNEAVEMAYENTIQEAKNALGSRRRPKA